MPFSTQVAKRNELYSSLLLANFVTMSATLLLVWLSLPSDSKRWASSSFLQFENGSQAAILILTIALIILSWRRTVDLHRAARDSDIARQREHQLAFVDEVTNLRNRRYLTEKLIPQIAHEKATLIMLDLDGFKKVNDLYGHDTGNQLLIEIAKRLEAVVEDRGTAFRLGGDEFAVLLLEDAAEIDAASALGAKLVSSIGRPVTIGSTIASVGASLGLSTLEGDTDTIQTLLHRSDIAMYEAKRLGRNRYVWFDADMAAKLNAKNLVEIEMRTGISENQFVPFFQPMLDLRSGTIKGYEVLARWHHPDRGLVMPDDFIPAAEASGQISALSQSVMAQALERAAHWPDDLTISVNLSPVQFKDPLLAKRILKLLQQTGFPAERLEVEITESTIVEDRSTAITIINSLKKAGVRIALDDFGTGYASLSQLNELPFDRIKIDKSFIAGIRDNHQNMAIVEAITALGKSLSLPVTAEGVEQQDIRDALIALGCSDAQGWLFGQAMSGDDVARSFPVADQPATNGGWDRGPRRSTEVGHDYSRRGAA